MPTVPRQMEKEQLLLLMAYWKDWLAAILDSNQTAVLQSSATNHVDSSLISHRTICFLVACIALPRLPKRERVHRVDCATSNQREYPLRRHE